MSTTLKFLLKLSMLALITFSLAFTATLFAQTPDSLASAIGTIGDLIGGEVTPSAATAAYVGLLSAMVFLWGVISKLFIIKAESKIKTFFPFAAGAIVITLSFIFGGGFDAWNSISTVFVTMGGYSALKAIGIDPASLLGKVFGLGN
jgi:hypothetical protein